MTDESKLLRQQDRGHRAKRVLENDLVVGAFEKIEAEIDAAWKNSAADDEKARYNAYLMHRLLQNFKQQFRHAVTTGEAAGKELLRLKDPSKVRRMMRSQP